MIGRSEPYVSKHFWITMTKQLSLSLPLGTVKDKLVRDLSPSLRPLPSTPLLLQFPPLQQFTIIGSL